MTIKAGDKTWDSLEDMFDEMERERAAEPWWKKTYRAVRLRLDWGDLRYAFRRGTKYRWQRGKRGWAENDVWGFDHYLAGVIAGGARQLIKNDLGHPANICSCEDKWHTAEGAYDECDGRAKWHKVLDEMASGFEKYNRDDLDYSRPLDHEVYRQYEKDRVEACQRSLDLLKRYFGNLWD